MPAPEIVRQLVQRFADHQDAYHSPAYNEAQLRQEFMNPFFEAMGWDVANKKDYAVQYREVIHEDSIHIKGSPNAKAPDYAFRLGGKRIFFVEAKKPAEDIENTKDFAYQLKIYAWNAQLPLSILTDFEEFAVYDCRSKPNRSDSPATGRVMYIRYDEYLDRWDEFAGIFSPDAIRKGAFDKYAEDNTAKKGTTSVDEAFLQEIEQWRALLARNIALRNPQVINERQLNFAVQMTIDRIIFLRICEDRGIEPQNQLLEMGNGKEIYPELVQLFQRADLRYNSGLFHFKEEKGNQNHVDTFTPSLTIDDKVLKTIIKSLYYPCPYVFKEIPVEILGQVYEQFLGKVIRLTPGHQAKIEEKPEVRKAGGVYYTPKYIVDYIVENTVGKLLEGKTPTEAAELKIVDPACGSGSFLLGAFQYLMDWHEDYYLAHDTEKWAKGAAPAIVQTADGDWRLTTDEKKRILVNNIHGVDIDSQAVEVTKLSLLLKVLEEETGQLTLGFERALPDLSDNIKCGNSLIGWDYFEGQLIRDDKEKERVNPFDWEQAFPGVFAKGGFDAVIGNPPYLAMENMEASQRDYYYGFSKTGKRLKTAVHKSNLYSFFWEKSLFISKSRGFCSFITPYSWMTNSSYRELRELLINRKIVSLVLLPLGIFKDAGIRTCVLVLQNEPNDQNSVISISDLREDPLDKIPFLLEAEDKFSELNTSAIKMATDKIININPDQNKIDILQSLLTIDSTFGNLVSINRGCDTAANDKYTGIEKNTRKNPKKLLAGTDFWRYGNKWSGMYLYYLPEKMKKEKSTARPGDKERFEVNEKIIAYRFLDENKGLICTYDNKQYYSLGSTYVISKLDNIRENIKYFLAILNSKLITFVNKNLFKGVKVTLTELNRIPIIRITFSNINDIKTHDSIVSLVDHMLDLHKRTPQTPFEQEQLAREIAATDAQIDRLVYELYGLTEEEIRIVEGG